MTRSTGFATPAIHHAYNPVENDGALTPPLHLTSTFAFETAEAGGEMFAGEREGHIYSRISNPTCDLLERRIAVLEGAEAGLALSSGMGAITAVLWTLLSPGDEVIVDKTWCDCGGRSPGRTRSGMLASWIKAVRRTTYGTLCGFGCFAERDFDLCCGS